MNASRRPGPRARVRDQQAPGAAAANRFALAAARRAQLEQVRTVVRLQLAATNRRRQELLLRRKAAPRIARAVAVAAAPSAAAPTAPTAPATPAAAASPSPTGGR